MTRQEGARSLFGCLSVDLDASRMLQVSRLCANLPVFASQALRACTNATVRYHPGEWLTIVAGNELFLWKYSSSNQQSHNPCLNFSLPVSDLPHNAALVALIFPTTTMTTDTQLLPPTGCVAVSSCGENLRLWPRLARNSAHTDVCLASLISGLYGDEAIQLEPTSVPGAFVLATRTGHLILIDPRNVRDGIVCRPLASSGKPSNNFPTPDSHPSTRGNNTSLLSGLGRRVSTLFNYVATSSGFGSRLPPARGGGNLVFVRLITRPSSTPDGVCRVYMLLESQLDVWTIDRALEEQMQGVYSIDSLLRSSSHDASLLGQWRAVDMAVQLHSPKSHSTTDGDQVYVLVSNNAAMPEEPSGQYHLVQLTVVGLDAQISRTIDPQTVQVPWPFGPCVGSTSQLDCKSLRLSLPASDVTTDLGVGSSQLYPCLLACVYCPYTSRAVVLEVLTGQSVARLEFAIHASSVLSNTSGRLQDPSVLIGCGSVDSRNLFVFLTRQNGLLALAPQTEVVSTLPSGMGHVTDGSVSSVADSIRGGRSRTSSVNMDSMSVKSSRTRGERARVAIRVVCADHGAIQVALKLTPHDGIVMWDSSDSMRVPLTLAPLDRGLVTLAEAARVYWMGFEEQASKYWKALLTDTDVQSVVQFLFLRFVQRLLNERPTPVDARWRALTSSNFTDEELLMPEGCCGFNYVVTRATAESPVLPAQRLATKVASIQRLKELWSLICRCSNRSRPPSLIPLAEVNNHLAIRFTTPRVNSDSSLEEQDLRDLRECRRYAGEQIHSDRETADDPTAVFACQLAEDDNEVEVHAQMLLKSLAMERVLSAADDEPLDSNGQCASAHLLACFLAAEEMVQFTSALQAKLSHEPDARLLPIFQSVALDAGFSPIALQTVKPVEAVFQTITLVPNLVVELGEAAIKEMVSMPQSLPSEFTNVDATQLNPASFVSASAVQSFMDTVDLLTAGLTAVASYRDRQVPILSDAIGKPSTGEVQYLTCWLTDARPYGVGDVLIQLFDHLVRLGAGDVRVDCDTHMENEDADGAIDQLCRDASTRAVEWAGLLLGMAQHRVRWATSRSAWIWADEEDASTLRPDKTRSYMLQAVQRLRRMRCWYSELRERLIDAIADHLRRPELALGLAERFADCTQIVRLCYLLETQDEANQAPMETVTQSATDNLQQRLPPYHHHRLVQFLRRVPVSYGLAHQALQWYFASGERSRVQSLLTLLEQLKTTTVPNEQREIRSAESQQSVDTTMMQPPKQLSSRLEKDKKKKPKHPESTVDPINRFLHRADARDHAWPHLLSTKQYTKASRFLFEEGCKETRYLGRRKALLGLAKMARLTSNDSLDNVAPLFESRIDETMREPSFCQDPIMVKIDHLLECIQLQEQLPDQSLPREEDYPGPDHRHARVLDIDTLARLFVSTASPDTLEANLTSQDNNFEVDSSNGSIDVRCGLKEFRAAFRLADLLVEVGDAHPMQSNEDLLEARNELVLHLWCQALKMNDWSKTVDYEDPIQVCSRSFVCTLLRDLSRTRESNLELLFTPERLFASSELGELANDAQFRYLIQSGFEYIQGIPV